MKLTVKKGTGATLLFLSCVRQPIQLNGLTYAAERQMHKKIKKNVPRVVVNADQFFSFFFIYFLSPTLFISSSSNGFMHCTLERSWWKRFKKRLMCI